MNSIDRFLQRTGQKMADDYEVLGGDKWLELRRTPDDYTYSHEIRSDGKIIAVLVYAQPYGEEEPLVLGRYERTPPHSIGMPWSEVPLELTSITGGVEKGQTPEENAVMETREEAGYEITEEDLESLGTVRPSKSTDTTVHLFAVDVSRKEQGEAAGDGSEGERDAYCDWIYIDEAVQSKDPLLHALIARKFL